jgi:hypothetical protein
MHYRHVLPCLTDLVSFNEEMKEDHFLRGSLTGLGKDRVAQGSEVSWDQ